MTCGHDPEPNGRRVHLLARAEMLNLTAATGHQIEIMDLGFALQRTPCGS
jgi:S-adenosylhomocysteine hydrolase